MKVFVAGDHLGNTLEKEIVKYLQENEIKVEGSNLKTYPTDDYPNFAKEVSEKVVENNGLGILICGNGIGMSIAANKFKGIRAARVLTVDDAFKAKNHNGANVITLDSNTPTDIVKGIVDAFITTKTPEEERHLRRIQLIRDIENNEL